MPQSEAVRLHFVLPVRPLAEFFEIAAVRRRFFEPAAYQGPSALRSAVQVLVLHQCVVAEERLEAQRQDEPVQPRPAVEGRLEVVVVVLIARLPANSALISARPVRLCLAVEQEGVAAGRRDSAKVVLSVVLQPEPQVSAVPEVPGRAARMTHNWNWPACSARQLKVQ